MTSNGGSVKPWAERDEHGGEQRQCRVARGQGVLALCLDEFPYLTAVDSSLPSQLQKWLDHALPPGCLLLLAGSSTHTPCSFAAQHPATHLLHPFPIIRMDVFNPTLLHAVAGQPVADRERQRRNAHGQF